MICFARHDYHRVFADRIPVLANHTVFGGGYTTDFIILNESTGVAPVRLTLTSTPM